MFFWSTIYCSESRCYFVFLVYMFIHTCHRRNCLHRKNHNRKKTYFSLSRSGIDYSVCLVVKRLTDSWKWQLVIYCVSVNDRRYFLCFVCFPSTTVSLRCRASKKLITKCFLLQIVVTHVYLVFNNTAINEVIFF